MRAPKCKLCGSQHWGVCSVGKSPPRQAMAVAAPVAETKRNAETERTATPETPRAVRPFKDGKGYSPKTAMYSHNCLWCGAGFRGSMDKSYCSDSCRLNAWRAKKRGEGVASQPAVYSWGRRRFAVLSRDGFRCVYCGRGHAEQVVLHVDHVIPRSGGGSDDVNNLVAACQECNLSKGAIPLAPAGHRSGDVAVFLGLMSAPA